MSIKVREINEMLSKSIKVEEGGKSSRNRKRLLSSSSRPRIKDEAEAEMMDIAANATEGVDPDDYIQDTSAMDEMAKYGLPTQFNLGGVGMGKVSGGVTVKEEKNRKGEKKQTYYCEVCELELNSHDTMTSHMKGVKHTKKTLLEEERRAQANSEGVYIPEKLVRQVQAARPQPKKIPVRLAERLREDNEPIVGLAYLEEVLACSNAEMEPFYECHLCGMKSGSNGMRSHVMGKTHREKYLQKLNPNDPSFIDPQKSVLMRAVDKLRENDSLCRINTIYSDELYPWPPGKAPWSIEQGGTGCAPTAANYNLTRRIRKQAILRGVPVDELACSIGNERLNDDDDITITKVTNVTKQLPASKEIKPIHNQKQLQEYLDVSLTLTEKSKEYFNDNLTKESQRTEVETLVAMVQSNVVALMNVPVREVGFKRSRNSPVASSSSRRSPYPSSSSSSSRRTYYKEEPHSPPHSSRRYDDRHSSYGPPVKRERRSPYRDHHDDRDRYHDDRDRDRYHDDRDRYHHSRSSSSSSSSHYRDRR